MSRIAAQILILADEDPGLSTLELALLERGANVFRARSESATETLARVRPDLVVVDPFRLAPRALTLIEAAGSALVALLPEFSPEQVRRALTIGAQDYLTLPIEGNGALDAERLHHPHRPRHRHSAMPNDRLLRHATVSVPEHLGTSRPWSDGSVVLRIDATVSDPDQKEATPTDVAGLWVDDGQGESNGHGRVDSRATVPEHVDPDLGCERVGRGHGTSPSPHGKGAGLVGKIGRPALSECRHDGRE